MRKWIWAVAFVVLGIVIGSKGANVSIVDVLPYACFGAVLGFAIGSLLDRFTFYDRVMQKSAVKDISGSRNDTEQKVR